MSESSLDEIHMFQGRTVKIRIIKKKEQTHARNKRKKHRTALEGEFSECWTIHIYFPHTYIHHSKRRGGKLTDFMI